MLLAFDAATPRFSSLPFGQNHGRSACNVTSNGCGSARHSNHLRFLGQHRFHNNNLLQIVRERAHVRVKSDSSRSYHPSEDIDDEIVAKSSSLSNAEIARTIVEVNNTASLLLSFMEDDIEDGDDSLSDIPYSTDEHGDIYFEVNTEESLADIYFEDKTVKIMIGLDSYHMVVEDEDINMYDDDIDDFDSDEITSDDSDSDPDESDDDDYDEVEVEFLVRDGDDDDEEEEEEEEENNWSEYETVNSCHPCDFAKNIAEAVADDQIEWIDHPPTGVVIQGLLRPVDKMNKSSNNGEKNNGDKPQGTAFLKLELMDIQLETTYGTQTTVSVDEYKRAKPDIIAHSASNIISRLKAGGEKITLALKSLCSRHKGLQVEEASVIGVDSLGFDVKVCAAKQMQVIRFAFSTRATSEFGAEKQIHDMLFPNKHMPARKEETTTS